MTAEIKPPLIALLGRVEEKNRSGDAPKRIAVGPVSREKQQAVWEMILKKIEMCIRDRSKSGMIRRYTKTFAGGLEDRRKGDKDAVK